ncbi:YolD-like family protein [Priestia megaterium]
MKEFWLNIDLEQAKARDRGMRKWRPFASMPEQYAGLNNVMNDLHKVEQPLLTEERYEEINQIIAQAIHYEKKVSIAYYKEGHIISGLGIINEVNRLSNILTYTDDVFEYKTHLPLHLLINVEFT